MDRTSTVRKKGLRGLRALIDSSLGRLNFDDLLTALLDRARTVLDADTAAILLLDEDSQMLIARAASGIEEEIYQNVQVPIGHGFAGKIASQRRPVMLERVDHTTVANPILWEKGIQAMLGVPLMSGDSVVGVLHVGRLRDQRFTEEDSDLLVVVAERVVLATQTGLLAAERAASAILERSLVPTALPDLPGLELAARYVTAVSRRGVGGDWYDVFQLPSGDIWITLGDVAGHGLQSAVVMGRLRIMIRVHAYEGAQPHEVLQSTDDEFQYFDPDQTATAICMAVPPSSSHVLVSSAGHPPPMLALPDRETKPLEVGRDLPLGVSLEHPRTTTAVRLPPGATLVLYTDGLIERRGESLALGLERLRQVVTTEPPDLVCRRVMIRLVGTTSPEDDIALVAARRTTG